MTFLRKCTDFAITVAVIAGLFFGAQWSHHQLQLVHAQGAATQNFGISPTFVLANCPSSVVSGASLTWWCHTGDGNIYSCLSTVTTCGSATTGWKCVAGPSCPATGGVTQVNGAAPGPTGNVTVSCVTPIPSSAATFTAGTSTSANFPAQSIPDTCTGKGS